MFRNILQLPAVSVTDNFFDLGGHSLLAVRLVAEVERVFGRKLPLVSLFHARSVEQLAELLRGEATAPPPFVLAPIRSTGHKRPLFLLARPNVNMLGYVALSRHIDPERPIYGLQYQYADERELGRPYTEAEYERWARSYIETIRLIQPHGPYLIGGMCEGALVAFTMTRLLEQAGERVAMLFTLDAWPLENTVRPLLRRVWRWEHDLRDWLELPLADQVRSLAQRVERRLGRARRASNGHANGHSGAGAGAPGPDEWSKRLWPGPGFVPQTVDTKIYVFRLHKQPYFRPHDTQCGWGNRTTVGVEVHYVPGDDHFNVLREPEVSKTGQNRRRRAAARRSVGAILWACNALSPSSRSCSRSPASRARLPSRRPAHTRA